MPIDARNLPLYAHHDITTIHHEVGDVMKLVKENEQFLSEMSTDVDLAELIGTLVTKFDYDLESFLGDDREQFDRILRS